MRVFGTTSGSPHIFFCGSEPDNERKNSECYCSFPVSAELDFLCKSIEFGLVRWISASSLNFPGFSSWIFSFMWLCICLSTEFLLIGVIWQVSCFYWFINNAYLQLEVWFLPQLRQRIFFFWCILMISADLHIWCICVF